LTVARPAVSGDFNGLTGYSELSSIFTGTNAPYGTAWYTYYNSRHRGGTSDGNVWGSQIAIGMTGFQDTVNFRTQSSGTWSAWTELLHDGARFQTKSGGLATDYLQTNNSGSTATLLSFNMERSWAFEQGGTGASTYLALRDLSGAKSFHIQSLAREDKFKFNPDSNLFTVTSDDGDSVIRIEADTSNTQEANTPRIEFTADGGATTFNLGLIGLSGGQFPGSIGNYAFLEANNGIQYAVADSLKGRWFSGGLEIQTGSNLQMSGSAAITRTTAIGGYLEGSYNIAGSNGGNTNPIYVIGSGYVPASTTLGVMYGIGYSEANASSFLNGTDLGTTPSTGWGMYVAAAGTAKIFLEANNGRGYFKNNIWAANFILNSDKAYKKDIEYLNDPEKVRGLFQWAKYQYKNEDGIRYGVIANDVEKTNPELVSKDSEGMRSLGYMDVLSLDASNKDRRITELEDTVKDLEARMERLELIIKDLL